MKKFAATPICVPVEFVSNGLLAFFFHPAVTQPGTFRLASDSKSFSGLIEMWLDGAWRPFCGELWDGKNDEVLCRQLGLGPPREISLQEPLSMLGSFPANNIYFNCSGNEDKLSQCLTGTITGVPAAGNICKEMRHAYVSCSGEVDGFGLVL